MNWSASSIWISQEKYEIRMVAANIWIIFGPDGDWADTDTSLDNVKYLGEVHLKEHPIVPIWIL